MAAFGKRTKLQLNGVDVLTLGLVQDHRHGVILDPVACIVPEDELLFVRSGGFSNAKRQLTHVNVNLVIRRVFHQHDFILFERQIGELLQNCVPVRKHFLQVRVAGALLTLARFLILGANDDNGEFLIVCVVVGTADRVDYRVGRCKSCDFVIAADATSSFLPFLGGVRALVADCRELDLLCLVAAVNQFVLRLLMLSHMFVVLSSSRCSSVRLSFDL